jgi:hypothetical protein
MNQHVPQPVPSTSASTMNQPVPQHVPSMSA